MDGVEKQTKKRDEMDLHSLYFHSYALYRWLLGILGLGIYIEKITISLKCIYESINQRTTWNAMSEETYVYASSGEI